MVEWLELTVNSLYTQLHTVKKYQILYCIHEPPTSNTMSNPTSSPTKGSEHPNE